MNTHPFMTLSHHRLLPFRGLVKISSNLYETILPMVRAQVESQIKVKDLGKCAMPGIMHTFPLL